MTSYAIAKMSPAQLKVYLEEQIDLFKKLGHQPTMAFTHELAMKEDGYYHLTKRDKSIEVIDWDLDGKGVLIAQHERMKRQDFFGTKPKEEDRLYILGHDICSVDVGETQDTSED